jgi:hypothetical protein
MESTILRFFTSSASSRAVQCVTGRPHCSGGSQATAMISVTCSAENFPAQPRLGESLKSRSIARGKAESFSPHSTKTNRSNARTQRRRHTPTMCLSHRILWAMDSFVSPANAKTIILARCATPCGQVLEPAIFLSVASCRSVTITFAAFPGMVGSPVSVKIETLGDCHNSPEFMEYQFCLDVLVCNCPT